ncbi:hypothetical protein O181_101103, partial [Austropuccinia psidii MF-1]|nr:hypothetical protein [Austropuccinia psidii MF-1]
SFLVCRLAPFLIRLHAAIECSVCYKSAHTRSFKSMQGLELCCPPVCLVMKLSRLAAENLYNCFSVL